VASSALETLRFPLLYVYGTTGWTPLLKRTYEEADEDVDVLDEAPVATAEENEEEEEEEEEELSSTSKKGKKNKYKVRATFESQ